MSTSTQKMYCMGPLCVLQRCIAAAAAAAEVHILLLLECIIAAAAADDSHTGPIEDASNTETSCMQAVQAAIVAAAAASRCSGLDQAVFVFDRTERLANSLGRMVGVVEQINNVPHDFKIMLMAGTVGFDGGGDGMSGFLVLGSKIGVVEQINNVPHDFEIMLMAGMVGLMVQATTCQGFGV